MTNAAMFHLKLLGISAGIMMTAILYAVTESSAPTKASPNGGEVRCAFMAGELLEGDSEPCSIESLGDHRLNGANGKLVVFHGKSGNIFRIWWPYINGNKAICNPRSSEQCKVFIKDGRGFFPGSVASVLNACGPEQSSNCFVARVGDGFVGALTWLESVQVAQSKPVESASGPSTHQGLSKAFTTTGLNGNLQWVKKYHQVILASMRHGTNLMGHGIVNMQVLSYEPGSSKGYRFWLSVNCSTREWKFLESDAVLMGGGLEGFGVIRGDQMGGWSCKRFGYSY